MVLLLGRTPQRLVAAPFRPVNYAMLRKVLRVVGSPVEFLRRYAFRAGTYPWDLVLRTPLGAVEVRLYSRHDLFTVAETFCRGDYDATDPEVVVDVGANIGLVSLYFLTRRSDCWVSCFEPDPVNIPRLTHNLRAFADRFEVRELALADVAGTVEFVQEETGRYGGLPAYSTRPGRRITVEAVTPAVLRAVLARHHRVDLLKISTEGSEPSVIEAIPDDVRIGIGTILYKDRVARVWRLDGGAAAAAARRQLPGLGRGRNVAAAS